MATKSPPARPTSTITWLFAPEMTISPASVARATVGELAMYTSSISRPSCFKKPASFITQKGELSALTADQAMTNFSARATPEKSSSQRARQSRAIRPEQLLVIIGPISPILFQQSYRQPVLLSSNNIFLEIKFLLSYGP